MTLDALLLSTPWTALGIPRIGTYRLQRAGEVALALFRKRGIPLPPGNRVQRALDLIRRINDHQTLISADSPDTANRALEAFRTLYEVAMIMWTSTERPRSIDPFPSDDLAVLLEGADLPSMDKSTRSRDFQFQLAVGAWFVLGGADIVPAEPDYSLLYHGERVGVAAKRLSSLKPSRVWDTLRDATTQISTNAGRGFVALSLDRWVTDAYSDDPVEVGHLFNERIRDAQKQIEKASGKACLLGVIAFAHWHRWSFDGPKPRIDWNTASRVIAFPDTDADIPRFHEYFNGLRHSHDNAIEAFSALLQVPTSGPEGTGPEAA